MTRIALPALLLFITAGCFEEEPTPPCDEQEHVEAPACIDPDEADVLQYQPLDECLASFVGCDAGGVWFEDACGCGCLLDDEEDLPEDEEDLPEDEDPMDEACIDPDEADVLQYQPLDECLASLIGCDAGGVWFEDACGCGCLIE